MPSYTYYVVGVGKTITVDEPSEFLAQRKVWSLLTPSEQFDAEWYDLISSDVSSFKAANDTVDALWVACVCPFFCAWQWIIGKFK